MAASDVPSSLSPPDGVCGVSLVSWGSARLRVTRTAGEGRACWCNAACGFSCARPSSFSALPRAAPGDPRACPSPVGTAEPQPQRHWGTKDSSSPKGPGGGSPEFPSASGQSPECGGCSPKGLPGGSERPGVCAGSVSLCAQCFVPMCCLLGHCSQPNKCLQPTPSCLSSPSSWFRGTPELPHTGAAGTGGWGGHGGRLGWARCPAPRAGQGRREHAPALGSCSGALHHLIRKTALILFPPFHYCPFATGSGEARPGPCTVPVSPGYLLTAGCDVGRTPGQTPFPSVNHL